LLGPIIRELVRIKNKNVRIMVISGLLRNFSISDIGLDVENSEAEFDDDIDAVF